MHDICFWLANNSPISASCLSAGLKQLLSGILIMVIMSPICFFLLEAAIPPQFL